MEGLINYVTRQVNNNIDSEKPLAFKCLQAISIRKKRDSHSV